jgi:hypothetical protein
VSGIGKRGVERFDIGGAVRLVGEEVEGSPVIGLPPEKWSSLK